MNLIRVMDYCDSIGVMLTGPLSYEEQKFIEEKSGSLVYLDRAKPFLRQFIRYLFIHQPTRESIRRLMYVIKNETVRSEKVENGKTIVEYKKIEVRLFRVDLARDFVFKTWEDSEKWGEFIKRHLVKKWHRDQQTGNYDDVTTYSSRDRNVPLNIACYSDKANRFTSEPNVHVEFRIKGSYKLKNAGINSLSDVLKLDSEITNYIDKHLTLRALGERAQNRIRKTCHGLNSSYQIGKKEFTYRWSPRFINRAERYGIQFMIDDMYKADKELKRTEESAKESIVGSTGESNKKSKKKSCINFTQYLDVLKLEYDLPPSASEENASISLGRGGLIMAGTEPSINELAQNSHIYSHNHNHVGTLMLAGKQLLALIS